MEIHEENERRNVQVKKIWTLGIQMRNRGRSKENWDTVAKTKRGNNNRNKYTKLETIGKICTHVEASFDTEK